MNNFDIYMQEVYPRTEMEKKNCLAWTEHFLTLFPKDTISDISMEDFLFAKKGYGNQESFCNLIFNNNSLASLGQCQPNMFGFYLKAGTTKVLSRTFSNLFGDDFEKAFVCIKNEIVNLLEFAAKNDYASIEKIRINKSFKIMILTIYYPDRFVPAPTITALKPYCNCVGLPFNKNIDPIYNNLRLVEWKNSIPQIKEWSPWELMKFCDWLWRNKKTISKYDIAVRDFIEEAKQIEEELSDFNLEGKDKEALVKVRVNQSEFRELLLAKFEKCALCGVSDKHFLLASHIKPWAVSLPEEKLDINNGFLLCPHHDKLFDLGFISFDEDGKIIISEYLNETERIFMNVNPRARIDLTSGNKKYLKYHREHIFRK